MGAVSGRELVLFEGKKGANEGFIINGDPRFVYLNVGATTNPFTVVSHEITHAMRRDVPDAYNGFTRAVSQVVDLSDEALLRFAQNYDYKHFRKEIIARRLAANESAGEILDDLIGSHKNLSKLGGREALLEEFHADLMGRASEHAETWRMVTEEMARQNPNVLRQFLRKIEQMAKAVREAFAGKPGFEHMDKFVLGKTQQEVEANLKTIRKAAAQALARYAGQNQQARDAMFAQRNGEAVPSLPRETAAHHKMEITREERELADKTKLTRDELAKVSADAKKFNLPAKMIEMEVRRIKARFPESAGWAPLTFLRVDPKTMKKKAKEKNPLPSDAIFFAPYGYQFHLDASGKDAKATHDQRVKTIASALAGEIAGKYMAAQQGDKTAQVIMRQADWYQALRGKLRATFGGFGDFLAQLLGPTSANNPVEPNFKYAVEALKLATSGKWDNLFKEVFAWKADMEAAAANLDDTIAAVRAEGKRGVMKDPRVVAAAKALKEASKYKGTLPKRENGKMFGMASEQIAQILAETWGDKAHGDAPKTKNYYQNIMGRTFAATIDVWAARTLRRLANDAIGNFPRIPPVAETAVAGNVLADNATSGSEFGFGQEVFEQAAKDLQATGIPQFANITPDAVQAMVWFIEKETWATRNWTTKVGEEGSIEHEMLLAGYPDRAQVDAWRVAARAGKPNPETKAFLKKDGSFNEAKYAKEVAKWEQAKAIGAQELAKIEKYPDRFVAGITTEIPNDKPTNQEMADVAREIEDATRDDKVMALRAQSSTGEFMGDFERTLDLEGVVRNGYNAMPLWNKLVEVADREGQMATFLSRVLREDETVDPLFHRPGVELYFAKPISLTEAQPLMDMINAAGVHGMTMATEGRRTPDAMAGKDQPIVGIRIQHIPEFMRGAGYEAGMSDASIQANVEAARDQMRGLVEQLNSRADVATATAHWYETRVHFYGDATGISGARPGQVNQGVWSGQRIGEALESADRFARDGAAPLATRRAELLQKRQVSRGNSGEGQVVPSPARAGSADDAQQGGKPAAGLPPQFGQARRGAVQVRGVHYSQQVRSNLSGAYYGTGMKGEEGARLADPRNADIRSRIYFYVDEGKGVTPESNVGPQAHDVDLNNLYDVKADPVGYRKAAAGDASKMERLIMQGGFDGYYAPGIFGSQGVAILIGNHSVPVRSLGMGYRGGEAQAPVQSKPAQETDADRVEKARVLPMGEMKGSDWKRMIPAVVAGADVSMLEDGRTYYKSDVVGAMRGAEVRYSPKRVTVNGVERPTENSDGKPIHYTEDGIINFWKWYDSKRQNSSAADRGPGENLGGVWSALDKQGRPRVFYHGTGDDVSAFDLDHENRLDQGWLGTGVYLASDRELANGYADIKKGPFKFGNDLNPGKPNVMPLYVALHNPLIVDDRQKQSLRKKARPRIDQWTAEAKAAGYDGVVMRFGDGAEEVVVFDPSAVKSATGNNGQFDSANPNIRYSPARWYFSPLEKAFESAPDKVFGKAQQVKLWLAANKSKLGLKDDEILWTGINDWLDLQGNGKVSKADVLTYLAGSGVHVEEVMKGRDGYDENNPQLPKDSGLDVVRFENLGTEWQDELESQSKLADYVVTDNFGEPIGLGKDEADAISDAYMGHPEYWEGDSSTKYGQYVLPGGENYRELLLTLPQGRSVAEIERQWNDMPTSDPRWQSLADERQRALGKGSFKSSHWDEANILAHIRMNDRTDADGNKVLFIEEVQSDWGQDGKKKGFMAQPPASKKPTLDERDALLRDMRQRAKAEIIRRTNNGIDEDTAAEVVRTQPRSQVAEWAGMSAEWSDLLDREREWDAFDRSPPIPAAPFVTDTKAWVSLAVKRIMAYAAANGYAKVAFVNGQQSAERYDLSKQISTISYNKRDNNEYAILAVDRNNRPVLDEDMPAADLEGAIGKELAQRIIDDPKGRGTLSGVDLQVGGEGMKAFYDRIVPQVVSDVLKKVGGGKMETVDVPRPYDLGEQYIGGKKERIQTKPLSSPQPGFAVTPAMGQALPLFSPARATPTLPAETKAQAAQRKGQDKFNRFGTLKEWAEANGLKLSEQADVYRAEERYHGRVATRLEDFREKTLKPLIEKIHKAGFTMQDVAAFLEAQHTPEANAHIRKLTNDPKATAAGVTDAEAATYLAQANPALARVANEFRQITEQSKRLLLKSGLISQEQADAWSGAYQHYVPLKGGPEEQAARTGQGPGMSVNAKQKRRLGHGKRAEFVIENIIRDHERAIMLSEKNLVGQHLLQAAIELQQLDPDLITIGKPEKRKVYVPGKTTYAIDYNGSTVAAFDSENEARRFLTFMGKSGMTIRQVTGDPHIQMTAAPMLQENEAGVYVQGQLVRVQINDEILARAYKNLGVENLNAVLRGARHLNTWLSKAYTGLNPEFILVNMARDFTGGLINITGNYGGGIATTAIANYPKAMMEILAYSMRGKTSANVQQYRENGGSTGGAYLSSLERVGQDIAAQYNEMVGVQENLANRKAWAASRAAGRKTFKFFTKWIEHMNAASENAMRLAVFMAVRDKTGSLAEAASAAKNSTVNFDRVGEAGRMAGALYLFANPNIQGTAGLWKSLIRGKHNGQAWALVGGLIALAVLAAMQFDDDEWKKIPEFEKDRNLLIRFGENRIKIPVPYGYGFFFGLGNVYRNIQAGDSVGKVSAHLASALFEHFSPFGNPVQSWTTMLPTAIKIPVQHAANVNDFNRQIVPENQFNKNKPDFLKMNRSTKGTAFDTISRGLNEMSGGTAGTSGAIDISPETTKTLWRTMTGGTGAFWTDLFSYGRLVYEDADRDLHEVPVVRKFAAEPRITDVRANYFEEVDKAKKVLDQFNAARKEHDQAGMDKLKAEKEMLALARAADASRAAIKAMRDKQDKILNDTEKPLAYRRAEVKQLERKEAELYQRILKAYGH